MMQIPHTTAGLEYEILRLSKSYSSRNPTALEILQLSKWLPEMIAAEEIEGDTTNLLWCAEFLARARTSLGTAEGKILQDTREQLPYDLPGAKAPIKTGDYVAGVNSVAGLKNVFTIERKSLTDMVACCGSGRERFERELERAKSLQRFWLVIEGSLGDILNHNSRSRIHPNAVTDSLVAWSIRVPGAKLIPKRSPPRSWRGKQRKTMNQKSTLKIRDTSKRKRLGMIMRLHRLALLKLMGEEVDTEPADPQKQFGGKKAASRFWWVRMSCNIKHPWAAFDPRIETSYGNSLGRYATEEEAAEAVRDALGFESINDLLREKHPESVTLLKSAPNKKREKNHD